MSVISENHGGPDAPEVISLQHRCVSCGKSLIGRAMVAGGDGDYCVPCAEAIVGELAKTRSKPTARTR